MSALNKNNPNGGGATDESLSQHVPEKVSVTSPDHKPSNLPLGGSKFLSGSPKGREVNPKPKSEGFTY